VVVGVMATPYLPKPEPEPGGCGETLLVTRLMFGIALPLVGALIGGVGVMVAVISFFATDDLVVRVVAAVYIVAAIAVGVVIVRRRRDPGDFR
jgi:uncharacterized membrane protein YqjE